KIYLNGMTEFSESPELMGNYAFFLMTEFKDYNQAEAYYKKALTLEPDHAGVLGGYAILLKETKKYHQAEEYYKKSLALDPDDVNVNGNYANFLKEIHK